MDLEKGKHNPIFKKGEKKDLSAQQVPGRHPPGHYAKAYGK